MIKKIIISILFACIGVISFFMFGQCAYAQDNVDMSKYYQESDEIYDISSYDGNDCEKLLDNNGVQYTIDRYEYGLLGNNIGGEKNYRDFFINGDDPIINIIPRKYFETECSIHVGGNGYAYYIKTTKEETTVRGLLDGFKKYCYKSNVLIVDIESNLDECDDISDIIDNQNSFITNKIIPYQYTFYTFDTNMYDGEYYYPHIFSAYNVEINVSKDNVVVPEPYDEDIKFKQSSGFELRNIICNDGLINLHDDNSDNGLFFNAGEIKYHSERTIVEYSDDLGNSILDLVNDTADIISVSGKIKTIFSIVKDAVTLAYRVINYNGTNVYVETTSNEDDTCVNILYNTKNTQLLNYSHLLKDFMMVLYNVEIDDSNDWAEFRFQFNNNDENINRSSRVSTTMIYDIYYGGEMVYDNASFESNHDILDKKIKDIYIDSNYDNEYNYSNSYQEYSFMPGYSQDYIIKATCNQTVVVKSYNGDIIQGNNYRYSLLRAKPYIIEVYNHCQHDEKYRVWIDIDEIKDSAQITMNGNSTNIIKFIPNESGVYKINSSNSNIRAYDEIKYYKANEIYQIKLFNDSSNIESANISISIPTNIEEVIRLYINGVLVHNGQEIDVEINTIPAFEIYTLNNNEWILNEELTYNYKHKNKIKLGERNYGINAFNIEYTIKGIVDSSKIHLTYKKDNDLNVIIDVVEPYGLDYYIDKTIILKNVTNIPNTIFVKNDLINIYDLDRFKIELFAKYDGYSQKVDIDGYEFYDYITTKEFSLAFIDKYVENSSNPLNESNKYRGYILASIQMDGFKREIYKPCQFLALFYRYVNYMQISYDDGMNSDAYIYGNAFVSDIILMNSLDFSKYGDIKLPVECYLYSTIDGNDKTISGLNIIIDGVHDTKNLYIFLQNYGEIRNVKFSNCNIVEKKKKKKKYEYIVHLFKNELSYGIMENVTGEKE